MEAGIETQEMKVAEVLPVLKFEDAEAVGDELHDHLVRQVGISPFERGDLALADMVQFVARKARERVAQREAANGC